MKKKPSDRTTLLLERRLIDFSSDKSKEKYVLLLEAFRQTDVLVPAALTTNGLPFGNEGILKQEAFKPDVIYLASENKRLMPIFSDQTKIPPDYISGKSVFMHCSGWIKAFYTTGCDGVIFNPFSDLSFLLTPDQIRILSLFRQTTSEYR